MTYVVALAAAAVGSPMLGWPSWPAAVACCAFGAFVALKGEAP